MRTVDREMILTQRIESEEQGLFNDINLWKACIPPGTVIRHHIDQFEQLCYWMVDQLEGSFSHKPALWPNLDQSTFKTLIVSVLSGKWILLRQVIQQRSSGSPYLKTLEELDGFADNCYQRLRSVLQSKEFAVKGISESSPLVYLGPIARLFLFDEEAPCLISAPFGAANDKDEHGKELSRQTIPHEVGHAIFEQISGLLDELKFKINANLARTTTSKKQSLIQSVILNWLEEMLADMTGTALAGRPFAESASQITIMPEKIVGITDGYHPIPLLRSFVHGWVLEQLDPETGAEFNQQLIILTAGYIDRPFESLPAVITVTMKEVKEELLKIVEQVWDCPLDTLHDGSLGAVFQAVFNTAQTLLVGQREHLPVWGSLSGKSEDVIFRLVGPGKPSSPLPGLPLYFDAVCCPLGIPICCGQ